MMNLEDYKIVPRGTIEKTLTKNDKIMLKKTNDVAKKIDNYLKKYDFQHAAELVYDFFWHEFCDKCIEDTKNRIRNNEDTKIAAQHTLDTVLKTSLKVLHPFMPFITEEIWQNLGEKQALIVSDWPKVASK
jgi:valyl-tRNA synthetase